LLQGFPVPLLIPGMIPVLYVVYGLTHPIFKGYLAGPKVSCDSCGTAIKQGLSLYLHWQYLTAKKNPGVFSSGVCVVTLNLGLGC
jgi:hypothetical protein